MSVTTEQIVAARDTLFEQYSDVICVNNDLDRTLVSFQANKGEPFYGWFKYKEGFSSRLVQYFIDRLSREPGGLLDPFAGAGASLFASRNLGWDAVGIELLPVGIHAINARHSAEHVNPELFAAEVTKTDGVSFNDFYDEQYRFEHLVITKGAFSAATERQMAGYLAYCRKRIRNPHVQDLFRFACFCILEEVSYTRKDGQYLRWDHRSPRTRVRGRFDKGKIPSFGAAIRKKLRQMAQDGAQQTFVWTSKTRLGTLDVRCGSCLEILPAMQAASIDLVITSPPYCNRYDYTRTYALELAFLGYDDAAVKQLRQEMLSCTVENKKKEEKLRRIYSSRGKAKRFEEVTRAFADQQALREVLDAIETHKAAGRLNNANIPRMVRNYFYEMAFVIYELARVLRRGGSIVLVNDNVRYCGEEVPVDLILSDFARRFGLTVRQIWTLPRGKGNSSQQMGSHGRRELRKCVYVWDKV